MYKRDAGFGFLQRYILMRVFQPFQPNDVIRGQPSVHFLWVRVRVRVNSIHCGKHNNVGHPFLGACTVVSVLFSAAALFAVGVPKRRRFWFPRTRTVVSVLFSAAALFAVGLVCFVRFGFVVIGVQKRRRLWFIVFRRYGGGHRNPA